MAYRRHILAVRNTTSDALAQALVNAQISDIKEANGWCWAMASVWTTGGGDLLSALEHLEGPVLLTTTEDGSRWWLHLLRKGQDRFSTFHDFTLLWQGTPEDDEDWSDVYDDDEDAESGGVVIEIGAPPLPKARLTPLDFEDDFFEAYADEDLEEDDSDDEEPDYEASPIDELLEDYEDLGAPLPESLIDALDDVPEVELKEQFLALHAAHIADTLQAYGVPHDHDEVLRILTGENVTEGELESDVGNLWRFLAHLGLGSEFEDAREELEEEDDGDEDYDPVAEILAEVAELEMHPVADGPAVVAAEDAPLLCRITQGLEDTAEFALVAQFDEEGFEWPLEPVPAYAQRAPLSGGTAMLFDAPNVPMMPKARKRIGGLLASLPNGATLELHAAGENKSYRICGKIEGGAWHIASTSFPINANEIAELIALFRVAEARGPQSLRDDAEANAVLEAAQHDMDLYDALPERTGLSMHCTTRERSDALASILFRLRFRHCWDVTDIERRIRDNFLEWAELSERMNQESALPVTGTVIYVGEASRFLEPDYEAPSVDETQRENATNTTKLDEEFSSLGFECLGTMVCERVGAGFLRCYANASERTYGVAYFMPYLAPWYDFVSLTEDDTFFTTTASAMESSIQSLRILIRLCSDDEIDALHRDHQTGLDILRERGMTPAPVDPTLKGIARTMDQFLLRRLGPEGDNDGS